MLNTIISSNVFFAPLLLWTAGASGALVLSKNNRLANWWGNSCAALGGILGLLFSLSVLISGAAFSFNAGSSLPMLSISFDVDRLSAFFIFLISLISLFASIYAIGYVKHYYGKYNVGTLGFFYNIFLAGMFMVACAHNALFFLVVWEIMSLASYFLVIYEKKQAENVQAGSLYFVMTHVGTAFITLAFLLLYRSTGSLDFGVIKESVGSVSPLIKNTVFVLALIGFGTKAGIIPFHIWLPSAHPAAPSHVSALMSGVMIKTGIYMFIRLFFDMLPDAPLWWGAVILILGAVSSLLGVLYALTEHDIKRLLAYSSIENIGIILLGIGGSLVFRSLDMMPLAVLSLVAALFHTLNHAVFKGLLFLGAGSVISQTHTRNMEEYGGLIKYMPQTALFFLAGSMAISALPPLNGFFSEWMTFQSLFSGIMAPDTSARWVFILAAGSLAFTGGLAAMCFVKAFGITFLARPRSERARRSVESGLPLRIGMAALSILTLVIGFTAGTITNVLSGVVTGLSVYHLSEPAYVSTIGTVGLRNGFASVSMPLILSSLIVTAALTFFAVRLVTRKRKTRTGRTWDCGADLGPRMEITGTGFSHSIVTIFRGALKPTKQTSIEYRDEEIRYFHKSNTVELCIQDIYNSYFYRPVHMLTNKASEYVKRIQSGNINMYVLYILAILIALLFASGM